MDKILKQLPHYNFFHFQTYEPFIGCQFERCEIRRDKEIVFYSGQRFFELCKIMFKIDEINAELVESSDVLDIIEITYQGKKYPFYCHK